MRLGVTPPVEVTGFRAAVDVAVAAERLGYTDVWTAEVGGVDAFAPLAAVAARTTTVHLGTALVPVFTRPPALIAMSAAGLQQLSGGRFTLGIGASTPTIIASWMGVPYERPVARIREYVEVLRSMLDGRKVSFAGEAVRVEGFRLQVDIPAPVPIHVGALGPAMLRLAGELADGVQFFLMTPEGVAKALDAVRAAAVGANRHPATIEAFIRLPVAMGEPADLGRFMARRLLTTYAITPAYNASLSRQGFGPEANAIVEAWRSGDRDLAASLFDDEMLDAFFLLGDAARCRSRIEEYRAAGITIPVLMPVSFAGTIEERTERVRATLEALAPGAAS